MKIAKLFINGHSQAVRLPQDCRFAKGEREVYVNKIEGMVILISKKNPWRSLLHSLYDFTEDFMAERNQPSHRDSREDFS